MHISSRTVHVLALSATADLEYLLQHALRRLWKGGKQEIWQIHLHTYAYIHSNASSRPLPPWSVRAYDHPVQAPVVAMLSELHANSIILQKPVFKQDKWLAMILLQTRAFSLNKQVILVTHKDHVPGLYIPLRHCARRGNQQLPRHPAVYSQNEKRQVRGIVEHVRLTMQERYSRSAVDCSIKRVPNAILGEMEGQTSQWEQTSHLHLRHEQGATKIDRCAHSIH